MIENKNIYASLNLCQCECNDSLPQSQKHLNDLGSFTSDVNVYFGAGWLGLLIDDKASIESNTPLTLSPAYTAPSYHRARFYSP